MKRLACKTLFLGALLGVTAGLVGCGKEVGRIPFTAEGTGSATLTAAKGKDIRLWTSLDVTYLGAFEARYEVRMVKDGATVATASCDPMDVSTKMMSSETTINEKHSLHYQGKMRCELTAPVDGTVTVEAKLVVPAQPGQEIRDLSLVVKQ